MRFWKKGSKGKGDSYLQFPTIFLSLKRLVPIAEEDGVKTNDAFLTLDEVSEFKKLHNTILISNTEITSTTLISSTNKQSAGVTTALYDWNQNSMGQDNLAKILLALFSFKRLKKDYPKYYKGGILAIDELDATIYPASQTELLKVLRKYASELNLQIFFTTHSLSLLKSMDELCQKVQAKPETANQAKIIYLQHSDNHILIKSNLTFEAISLNLNVLAKSSNKQKNKITAYVEDKETELFVKAILKPKLYSCLNFMDVTLPCSMLMELANKNIPAFSYPYSIIFLDGDVRLDKALKKKMSNTNNVLLLPGKKSPERLIADYLYNLSDQDSLWETLPEGYTKQLCFRQIKHKEIFNGEDGRKKAKEWFNSQRPYWGRNGAKVLNPFFATIQKEVNEFKSDFEEMLKRYIHN